MMKIRKENEPRAVIHTLTKGPSKSLTTSKPTSLMQRLHLLYISAAQGKKKRTHLWDIMEACYNDESNQDSLCTVLDVPFTAGPVSINPIPQPILDRSMVASPEAELEEEKERNHLHFLLNYLRNVREYYFCWVIHFSQQLGIISLKLCKKQEIQDNPSLFDPEVNLIGIFVGKKKVVKSHVPAHLKTSENKPYSHSIYSNFKAVNSTPKNLMLENNSNLRKAPPSKKPSSDRHKEDAKDRARRELNFQSPEIKNTSSKMIKIKSDTKEQKKDTRQPKSDTKQLKMTLGEDSAEKPLDAAKKVKRKITSMKKITKNELTNSCKVESFEPNAVSNIIVKETRLFVRKRKSEKEIKLLQSCVSPTGRRTSNSQAKCDKQPNKPMCFRRKKGLDAIDSVMVE